MGAQFSKRSGEPQLVLHDNIAIPTVGITNNTTITAASTSKASNDKIQYKAELNSYEAECRLDPEIQSFDTTLQRRMSRAISSLAVGVEVRSLSLDSLREITTALLDMNQEVVKIILDCKKDIWKNPELFDLVEEYFENSLHTLDFCTALEKCLKKARDTQLILHVAFQRFEEEEEEEIKGDEIGSRYGRTLEEMKNFRVAGDPFTEKFFREFQSIYQQQMAMLNKLRLKKNKLDKKLKSVKAWRKMSSIIFISAFVAVLICSVVAAAISAPPVVTALIAAVSVPPGSMGKWIDSLWKGYEDALKAQKEMIHSMQVGSYVTIMDLDSIRILIDRLEIQINEMLHCAEFTERGEEELKIGVKEIKNKLALFMKSIEDLGEQVDRCSRDIRRARTVVLQRIIKNPK